MPDRPVLLGVGISTPEQAAQAAAFGDGVIVGSALVRRLLDGGGPGAAARLARPPPSPRRRPRRSRRLREHPASSPRHALKANRRENRALTAPYPRRFGLC